VITKELYPGKSNVRAKNGSCPAICTQMNSRAHVKDICWYWVGFLWVHCVNRPIPYPNPITHSLSAIVDLAVRSICAVGFDLLRSFPINSTAFLPLSLTDSWILLCSDNNPTKEP